MSSCSSCSSSANYVTQLAKQAASPPAVKNPAEQKPPSALDALKTSGPAGRSLNITA